MSGRDLFNPEGDLVDRMVDDTVAKDGPVECLGKTFTNDTERREYYLGLLAEKLKDPVFRKIEGFPIGENEDILNLSDPPYYTACPNPWCMEFVDEWDGQKPSFNNYQREPFSSDVSEGKNDPLYNAHSYHTKVPPKAIARFIKHYTNPGDIILDGFSGTGMTSVATQMVNLEQSTRGKKEKDIEGFDRKCISNDLAPIGAFITRGLLSQVASESIYKEALSIVDSVEKEFGWLYQTVHEETGSTGVIDYVVWSDILSCSECAFEIDAYDAIVDRTNKVLLKEFFCPECSASLKRRNLSKVMETKIDVVSGEHIRQPKQKPKLVQFKLGAVRARKISTEDNEVQKKAYEILRTMNVPSFDVQNTWRHHKDGNHIKGYTHTHHFYTYRNLLALVVLRNACLESRFKNEMLFILTGFVDGHANRRNRYLLDRHHPEGTTCGPLSNSLFVAELQCEVNIFLKWRQTLKKQLKAWGKGIGNRACIQTGSATQLLIRDSSIDYIFVDPPFGKNIIYSDLNLIYEHWLGVRTAVDNEAIVNEYTEKNILDYGDIMTRCFSEFYRVLKPGRWITLEFHNSLNSVWNSMQEALFKAGFVVADVRALDKKHGTIHQDSGYTVKQDLIVSAYKAADGLENKFEIEAGSKDGVWEFVREHLGKLPVFVSKDGASEVIAERREYLLYDRMVAFHVQRGFSVPMSAPEFLQGINQRFIEKDGMYFLDFQFESYEKKKSKSLGVVQLSIAVSDEASAIQWLREMLKNKPSGFQEIQPNFIKEIGGWSKLEFPIELVALLEQNFIKYDSVGPLPPQIHSYLSTNFKEFRNLKKDDVQLIKKAKDRWYVPNPDREEDLQKLRERSLLIEFGDYKKHVGKKLKKVRIEAVRCGFKKAWQERDYSTIISVAEKIPQDLLQEDQKLLMWYDQAQTRSSDDSLF
jgi:DNA modification methylase